MNRLPARTGWLWLSAGFALFRAQPGVLIMLLFANLLISLLITRVPLIGPVVAMVLIPSFSMAIMQACRDIDEGRRTALAVLATGFRAPAVRNLCKLGLVYLGVAVLLTVLARATLNDAFLLQLSSPIDPKNPPELNPSDVMSLMGIFMIQIVALMLMCFASPLACWQNMKPGKATFYSVFAVLGAWRPFLVMLLGWFSIFFGMVTVLTYVLGNGPSGKVVLLWIILLFVLLLQCAIYAAYRQIFGMPEVDAKASQK
jgi:hypothetical protein